MKTSIARSTRIITLAICLLVSPCLGGFAAAEGIKANLNFPEGLPAGKEVPVTASLEGDTSSLKGSPVAAIYETGQDGESIQVDLGKVGEELKGKLTPRAGMGKVTFRFSGNGKNYAQVAALRPEDAMQATSIQYEFDVASPSSRSSTPALPVSIWILGALALGFYALRGKKSAF
jgi:hypothetical protein